MKINDSHICNLLSLELIADYYEADCEELKDYYKELKSDRKFLAFLNQRIKDSRNLYSKGIFSRSSIDSVDWFGNQRVSLYVLIRMLKPQICVETGVFYGGNTAFILNALRKNKKGRLISIDLLADKLKKKSFHRHNKVGDSELLPKDLNPGFLVPQYLKDRWEFIEGDSLGVLKKIRKGFSFFCHDSEHSHKFVLKELELAKLKMPLNSTMFVDDIDWSNGFFEFCVKNKIYPLLLSDNGKQGLKVRLGLVRLNHTYNKKKDVTG